MTFLHLEPGEHHLTWDSYALAVPIVLANEDGSYVQPLKTSHASLVVLSDELSPSEISAALRLEPDEWGLRGEFESHPPRKEWRRSRPFPHNRWSLESRLPDSLEPQEHLADLLDQIGAQAQQVADLAVDPRVHSVRLWLYLFVNNANPGISLDRSLISRLAALGTGVDIDVSVDLNDEPTPRDWQSFE